MNKFNSQICTNAEQSKRLLELGLKPETADCCLDDVIEGIYSPMAVKKIFKSQIPAWSLHRLLVILNPPIVEFAISSLEDAYEDVIYNISESIKNGYINKEYLNDENNRI